MVDRRSSRWLLCAAVMALACAPPAQPATPTGDRSSEPESSEAPTAGEAGDGSPRTDAPASPDGPATEPAAARDPYADMPHPPETDSGRHQLAAADVNEVVTAYRPHMRDLCWIPRVNENSGGKEKARVAIEVEVTPAGEVKSVRAVGGNDYPGLADCVREHVKRWHFPKAQQTSSLMFPILFERGEAKLIRVE